LLLRGKYYYLYGIGDIYSHKGVGLEAYEQEWVNWKAELKQHLSASHSPHGSALGVEFGQRRADETGDAAEQTLGKL
jgi:hypothetical protein